MCCRAHRRPTLPVKQLEWRWVEKRVNRTARMASCVHMLTLVTNVRCRDGDRAACDFCMRSTCEIDRSRIRRNGHPVNVLMGCRDCCESVAAEIVCTVSSRSGLRAESNRQCGISSWEPTDIENRHRLNHLRVVIAFCICVAPCCEVFGENCAIAVN